MELYVASWKERCKYEPVRLLMRLIKIENGFEREVSRDYIKSERWCG